MTLPAHPVSGASTGPEAGDPRPTVVEFDDREYGSYGLGGYDEPEGGPIYAAHKAAAEQQLREAGTAFDALIGQARGERVQPLGVWDDAEMLRSYRQGRGRIGRFGLALAWGVNAARHRSARRASERADKRLTSLQTSGPGKKQTEKQAKKQAEKIAAVKKQAGAAQGNATALLRYAKMVQGNDKLAELYKKAAQREGASFLDHSERAATDVDRATIEAIRKHNEAEVLRRRREMGAQALRPWEGRRVAAYVRDADSGDIRSWAAWHEDYLEQRNARWRTGRQRRLRAMGATARRVGGAFNWRNWRR